MIKMWENLALFAFLIENVPHVVVLLKAKTITRVAVVQRVADGARVHGGLLSDAPLAPVLVRADLDRQRMGACEGG